MSSQNSIKIALFTGGIDKHYATGLTNALIHNEIAVDFICNAEMAQSKTDRPPSLNPLELYATPQMHSSGIRKLLSVLLAYARIIRYAATSDASIFHILWNYKVPFFDRTLLLLFFKLRGKRVVFTAHNVNAGERDGSDSLFNRISLRSQYRLVDHIFVHTEKMRDQIVKSFAAQSDKISIIPFGTYDMVPQTSLTSSEAKQRLGVRESDCTILFFGRIVPYKGIDLLVDAFLRIAKQDPKYRLVIAGEPMKGAEQYWRKVRDALEMSSTRERVIQHTHFIADNEIEIYLKAADVLVLPYTQIFQSGVLFMSYSFGLPVIATDVGSFGTDIISGVTGFVCRPNDPIALAEALELYFRSRLFCELGTRRTAIRNSIEASHSWTIAAAKTCDVYAQLLRNRQFQYSV